MCVRFSSAHERTGEQATEQVAEVVAERRLAKDTAACRLGEALAVWQRCNVRPKRHGGAREGALEAGVSVTETRETRGMRSAPALSRHRRESSPCDRVTPVCFTAQLTARGRRAARDDGATQTSSCGSGLRDRAAARSWHSQVV
eukprot:7389109-Prymnesium_polylepis.1